MDTIPVVGRKEECTHKWIEGEDCYASRMVAFTAIESTFFAVYCGVHTAETHPGARLRYLLAWKVLVVLFRQMLGGDVTCAAHSKRTVMKRCASISSPIHEHNSAIFECERWSYFGRCPEVMLHARFK